MPTSVNVEAARAAGLIGDLFLERGLITVDQLDAALEEQRANGQRLGEILISMGLISRLDLADALSQQWQRQPSPDAFPALESPAPHLQLVPPQNNEDTAPTAALDLDAWFKLLQAELDQLQQQPAPNVQANRSFLAFAPTPDGYRLVECQGTNPTAGDHLQLSGWDHPLVVTRVGHSPLPADKRPCAYLEHAPPAPGAAL